jgi:hypothetical protein
MRRPTIISIRRSMVVAATASVPTLRPSRKTVTRSPISNTSSRRCRGRLVENQDFDVLGKRLRDFDEPPFARGQLSHAGVRIDLHVHPLEQDSHGVAHRGAVNDGPSAAPHLPPGVDVLGHVDFGKNDRMLIDDSHAGRAGRLDAGRLHLLAPDQKDAAVLPLETSDDLDQSRFAGAVFAQEAMDLVGA